MKLPKIKMLYLRSAKTEPHTKEEMDFVANCQNDIEIYSIETCAKSIRKPNGMYYVELFGYSWSSEHYDEKNGSKWNDFRRLPFTNGNFDIEWAISEFGLSENYAIKYFGYKKIFDPQFLPDISFIWQIHHKKAFENKAKILKLKVVRGGKDVKH